MTTRAYSFHGLGLSIAGEEAVLAALHARLGGFQARRNQDTAWLRFEFHKIADAGQHVVQRPEGAGRPVLEAGLGQAVYFGGSQQLYLEIPERGRALCDITSRRVRVSYPEAAGDPWLLSHPFFTIPLAEMVKRDGLFMAHAAGLAVAGKGILVAGQSGTGKTTLALALLRAGFDFLADDTVFLCVDGTRAATGEPSSPQADVRRPGLRLLAFPDEVDVTAQTLQFFPELNGLIDTGKPNGRPKHAVDAARLATLYGIRPCRECVPEVLVFPRPGKTRRSILTPMAKGEALVELACNVLRTEPRSSQAHLDVLAALVRECRCYRLKTGRDFERLPGLLRSALN